MKAVVKKGDGKNNWALMDMPRNDPGSCEVEIQVKAAGICGSELHYYHDNHFYTPGTIVGHEFCGVISRVGSEVLDWKVGDRVVAELNKAACGKCEFCRKGMPNFCPYGKAVGYGEHGGWAEYYISPENMLIAIPDSVSFDEASMTEPTNVACQALIVKKTVKLGDTVLVQGCGTIGLISAMVAKAIGASHVIVTGAQIDEPVRLQIARSINAIDAAVNIEKEDLSVVLQEMTGRSDADVIVEASGSVMAIQKMTQYLKKTGTIVVLGETAVEEIPFRWNEAVFKACTMVFSFGEVYEAWEIAMKLMASGKLELEKIITHRLPLEEFRKGFELLDEKKALKVILNP